MLRKLEDHETAHSGKEKLRGELPVWLALTRRSWRGWCSMENQRSFHEQPECTLPNPAAPMTHSCNSHSELIT